jgi:LmbE family N-acetylglucosaminyl deacetylase
VTIGGSPSSVLVVSPHLDDAVFSLGAAMHRMARRGRRVQVVTVMAGDPASATPAGPWDRRAGFATAGEAARSRREEDRRACSLLGVRPLWLSFPDEQYRQDLDGQEVWGQLAPLAAEAAEVFVPGFPLTNPGHRWTAELVLENAPPDAAVALYAEQPYATWEGTVGAPLPGWPFVSAPGPWRPLASSGADRLAKLRACRRYRSQLPVIHPRPASLALKVWRFEHAHGGELVAPLSSTNLHR